MICFSVMSICTWASLQSTARPQAACLQLMSSPTRPQPALQWPWARTPATPCPPMRANRPLTLRKPSYRTPRDSYKHTHTYSQKWGTFSSHKDISSFSLRHYKQTLILITTGCADCWLLIGGVLTEWFWSILYFFGLFYKNILFKRMRNMKLYGWFGSVIIVKINWTFLTGKHTACLCCTYVSVPM